MADQAFKNPPTADTPAGQIPSRQLQGGRTNRRGLPKIDRIHTGVTRYCGDLGPTGYCHQGRHDDCAQASFPASEWHDHGCPGHDYWRCPCPCHREAGIPHQPDLFTGP